MATVRPTSAGGQRRFPRSGGPALWRSGMNIVAGSANAKEGQRIGRGLHGDGQAKKNGPRPAF